MDGKAKSEIVSYFTEVYWRSDNPNGVRGQVGAFHRTLSTYLNSLVEAGLTLERFVEPQATGKVAEHFPRYKEIPAVLIVRCKK